MCMLRGRNEYIMLEKLGKVPQVAYLQLGMSRELRTDAIRSEE